MAEGTDKTDGRLTLRQQKFVEAYLKNNGNGVAAAREAGYAGEPNVLAVQASTNLTLPKIQSAIRQRLRESTISAEEVLKRLSDQATFSIEDFYDFGAGLPFLNLEKARERGKLHLLKGIEYSTTGKAVLKFHDSQTALVHLGRHYKLFTDRVDHDFSKFSDAELIREAASALSGVVAPGADEQSDDESAVVPAAPPDDETA